MACREFRKNNSETVRVASQKYQGYDLIDIRVFAKNKDGDFVPTRKGIALNVDQVPELIDCLEWALQQPCEEDVGTEAVPPIEPQEAARLTRHAYNVLAKHGVAVHWDVAESMVLDSPAMAGFTKWHLHYVLATRRDLFQREESGCFRTIDGQA